jgi:hypothetical protein
MTGNREVFLIFVPSLKFCYYRKIGELLFIQDAMSTTLSKNLKIYVVSKIILKLGTTWKNSLKKPTTHISANDY